MEPLLPLDDRDQLVHMFMTEWGPSVSWIQHPYEKGDLFCTTCGRRQRQRLSAPMGHLRGFGKEKDKPEYVYFSPALFRADCLQCNEMTLLFLHPSPTGTSLAVVRRSYGGESTPHTPNAVKYYLDQAQRCHSMGANSGAVAMYRSALETLLFLQGFEGMLGKQLIKLEKQVAEGNAPEWYKYIDSGSLDEIRELGNMAVHANNGDISLQDNLDAALIHTLSAVTTDILDAVYEREHRDKSKRERLNAARQKRNAEPKTPTTQPLTPELEKIHRVNEAIMKKADAQTKK